jgi:hypothetical protein
MNRILLSIIFIGLAAVSGCQETDKTTSTPEPMEVFLDGTGTFPQQMVGIWENESHGWIIRFEKDGHIRKIRHTVGRANLIAGEKSTFPLIRGGEGIIEPGLWTLQYNAIDRELTVEISLDKFSYKIDNNLVTGSSIDVFIGKIPEAGETEWRPEWISHPLYVASTADKVYQDYELPFEEGDEYQGEIVFKKVDTAVEK